nr:MAG: glycoprotein [Issyk-Kul virus]
MRHTNMFNFKVEYVVGCIVLCYLADIAWCGNVSSHGLSVHLFNHGEANTTTIQEGGNVTMVQKNVTILPEGIDKTKNGTGQTVGNLSRTLRPTRTTPSSFSNPIKLFKRWLWTVAQNKNKTTTKPSNLQLVKRKGRVDLALYTKKAKPEVSSDRRTKASSRSIRSLTTTGKPSAVPVTEDTEGSGEGLMTNQSTDVSSSHTTSLGMATVVSVTSQNTTNIVTAPATPTTVEQTSTVPPTLNSQQPETIEAIVTTLQSSTSTAEVLPTNSSALTISESITSGHRARKLLEATQNSSTEAADASVNSSVSASEPPTHTTPTSEASKKPDTAVATTQNVTNTTAEPTSAISALSESTPEKPITPTSVSRQRRRTNDWTKMLHITVHSPRDDSDISTAELSVRTVTNLSVPAQYSTPNRHENTRFFSLDLDSDVWDYKSTNLPGQKVSIICAKGALEGKLGEVYPHVEIKDLWPGKTSENLTACEFANTCPGTPIDVKLPNVNYDNIKVMSTPDMPVVIINYLTTHYGFLDYNMMFHFENRGCLYLIPIRSNYCWFLRSEKVFSPVSTIVIERKFLTAESKMLMCAIKRLGHGEVKGTWKYVKQPIRIWFKDDRTMGMRKLLSVQVKQQAKVKTNTYCHSRSHLIPIEQHQLHTKVRAVPRPRIAICNDSVITELPLGQEHGCYSVGKVKVHYQCTPEEHAVQVPNECNITVSKSCTAGEVCFLVNLNGQGHVSSAVVGHSPSVKRCLNSCVFKFKKTSELDVLFTCPGGKQHRVQTNVVDIQCPMHEMLGRAALYICRATYRPKALYFTLFWLTFGYVCFCLVMEVLKITVLIICKVINFCMEKADKTRGYCEHCKLWVNSYQEWWDHKSCCACKCPFCSLSFARREFPRHAEECTSRSVKLENINAVLAVRRTPRILIWIAVALTRYFKTVCRLSWATVLIVMCLLIISPVQSLKTGPLPEGIWDEYENEVLNCKENCIKALDSCICEDVDHSSKAEFSTMRKLSSVVVQGPTPSQPEKIHRILKSIDVEAPWGTLHVPESYTPAQSAKHISLTWESSQAVGDKIVLSGRSSTVLKLEPKTSTVWTMENKEASEKKTLTISVLDFTQIYSAEFLYATGDRNIKTWSEGSCKGDCPLNCGCNTQTCHIQNWLNVRNWRCNPTWCWRVGTGCSCCASDITELYSDWLATIWKIEHKKTAVIACVEFDHEQRVCESVEAGVEVQLGPVKVEFSDPFGENQILNQRIALFHKIPKMSTHVDLFHNFGVTSATSFCNIESCTHGTVGDYQIYDPDVFVLDDVTSANYFKKLNNKTKVWMSWEGVSVSYYCNPGDWTTCVTDGVVERNSEAFANVFKSETNYSTTHFFHSSRVVSEGKALSLDLKARPLSSGGDITAYITVDGLELYSKEIHLEGLKISIGSCTGCFACNLGATCSFTLAIRRPERFNLHITSDTAGVVVPDTSFLVEADRFNTYNIKIFSVEKDTNVCIKILEGKFCKTCPKENLVACKRFSFEDPKEVALEHRSTIFAKSTQSCGNSTLSCMLSGTKSFFSGIGGFFNGYFGSIFKGVLSTVLPIALIVLTIFFGPKLSFILRLCKKGRALKSLSYEPMRQITDIDEFLKKETSSDEGKNFLKSVLGPKLKPA